MKKQDKLESNLIKAKAAWRRVCERQSASADDRRMARAAWKKAQFARDRALAQWRAALAERRKAAADRRKAKADGAWNREHGERRKMVRRP